MKSKNYTAFLSSLNTLYYLSDHNVFDSEHFYNNVFNNNRNSSIQTHLKESLKTAVIESSHDSNGGIQPWVGDTVQEELPLIYSINHTYTQELHWLPVVYRIKFKLALVMFTIHTHQCPDYLTDSVHPYSNNDPARYWLRSATGTNYSVPRTRTKFGDRAFSVAGPVVWNSLPAAVRHADSLHSFKCRLKSHFFSLCFNDWQCNALQVQFRAWRALNSLLLTYLLTYLHRPHTGVECTRVTHTPAK